ncbi:avidin/streptavidin family protein [Varunaivibrio sulfuroxidans]|uniref:Avidin family protein n=1 Tax=Varunaivibrio sulfuroxidans TaxID=1773489 RepID=A0A4V2UP11_9PROT|nr:avidin/streptavidin family protein [Varunaivibrio sulfuroxidans]TCS64171.1 avidin family protein [Varunaivibrio sulfuroxidans]WES31383.1 avidin/streptavidin family protein [Varunaivibrio sulfuroxidans]
MKTRLRTTLLPYIRAIAFALVLFPVLSVGAGLAFAQDMVTVGSAWQNQRGSVMYIESVGPDGSFRGVFVNKAAGTYCQNTPYPMTGRTNQSALAFVVNWKNGTEDCKSITAWAGYISGGHMTTKWNLSVAGSTKPDQIMSGVDVFKPLAFEAHDSLMK